MTLIKLRKNTVIRVKLKKHFFRFIDFILRCMPNQCIYFRTSRVRVKTIVLLLKLTIYLCLILTRILFYRWLNFRPENQFVFPRSMIHEYTDTNTNRLVRRIVANILYCTTHNRTMFSMSPECLEQK